MNKKNTLKERIEKEFINFTLEQKNRFPDDETLTIDLHCHDHNSDVPDEILGRILGVPETWLSTDDLVKTLYENGSDTITVTNHNNARSCYELRERGMDVITGAEFSCHVPDFNTGIHVLTYGFTPSQEKKLNELRSDLYKFQEYTAENDIPTIWAHPLYHYRSKEIPTMEFFDTMALLFERFEIINGQRDTWQNMLVKNWVERLTEEKINKISSTTGISPDRYCRNPYKKSMAGGSDSHMGIFAGQTGTKLYVPDLEEKLKILSKSKIALDAIKKGNMAPFGTTSSIEKITVSILDYFCQIGINMEDPGLIRTLLHKGETKDKLLAFAMVNFFSELKRHKHTMTLLKLFHGCFKGKVPRFTKRLMVSKPYKPVFDHATKMASTRKNTPELSQVTFEKSIKSIYRELSSLLVERIKTKAASLDEEGALKELSLNDLVKNLEVPVQMRNMVSSNRKGSTGRISSLNLPELFDGLSFPFLASSVIMGAHFTGANVMYKARPLLNNFSRDMGCLEHPERMLWLTDTFEDKNGVATVLNSMLEEIRRRDLPIDIMVCSSTLKSEDHLVVVPPVAEFKIPFYEEQPVRIPDIMDIHEKFQKGEYDRVICSTEGPMGLASHYLKNAFTVPAYFYIHTDWMAFAERVLGFDRDNRSRVRRILRAFYSEFDRLFVLNTEQQKWLAGSAMNIPESKISLTAHWAEEIFTKQKISKEEIFDINSDEKVILFTGRISEEKGVMEIPGIYKKVKNSIPDAKFVFAGTGPAEKRLKELMPDALFMGWIDHAKLPQVYSAADMMILPSKFDTFGCVVLEAMSCGLPVTAYRVMGPADIIENEVSGYLCKKKNEMSSVIIDYLSDKKKQRSFKKAALTGAARYSVDSILEDFLEDTGLNGNDFKKQRKKNIA